MAETAVNLVVDKLIPLLREEANLLGSVSGQISSINDMLLLIRAYLRDKDAKAEAAESSDKDKEWLKQMRQVSIRIQDAIDQYLYKVANNNRHPQRRRAARVLCKICDLLRTAVRSHQILSQIGEIRGSIKQLLETGNFLGLNTPAPEPRNNTGSNSKSHYLRRLDSYIDDDQLVGVKHTKELLNGWLSEEASRTVIAVVGEGGLGKTTVVWSVYNEQKKSQSFNRYAWVNVSHSLKREHLLRTFLFRLYQEDGNEGITEKVGQMDDDTLEAKIRKYLKGRKYFVVFDDVRKPEQWGEVQLVLPKDNGRVIITTRNKEVAKSCRELAKFHIHELKPLDHENALKLFLLRLLQFDPEGCPEELMPLAEKFVKKCDGVPLAIVAIASYLSTKNKNFLEWNIAYDSLSSKFSSDPYLKGIYQVLSESYHDLSYHLKSCLLYFGLFPRQYSITCERLINLWIAEGFVEDKEKQGQTLNQVAEEYLAELIGRSLVKVDEVYSFGKVRSCRVHDLMHHFILKKCEELNFCQVEGGKVFRFHEWTRRLSINTSIEDAVLRANTPNAQFDRKQFGLVRSFLIFNTQNMPATLVHLLFSSFKLLVTLDCEGAPLYHIPEAVGNLFHLKYLNLRDTKIKTIPKFIAQLQNLETLDLKGTQVIDFPKEINSLVKLRHLQAYYLEGVKLKEGIGNLTALHTLAIVDAGNEGDDIIITELKNLGQMRALGINNIPRKHGKLLCNAIQSMTYLCSLTIIVRDDEFLDLDSLSCPPPNLQRLYLTGRLEKLPHWIPKLKNLIKLMLANSRLTQDPLPLLADMSSLLELVLDKSYEGDELHFRKGWFKNLKSLKVVDMPNLINFIIDEGGLSHLQEFTLFPSPQIIKVPNRVQKVAKYSWKLVQVMKGLTLSLEN